MNASLGVGLRRASRSVQTPLQCYQRRWAQVHDVRFVSSHLTSHRVIDKYRAKLDQKARQTGVKDIDELKDVYAEKIQELRKQAVVPGANAPLTTSHPPPPPHAVPRAPFQAPPPPPPQTPSATPGPTAGIKTLASFIDVDKAATLAPTEIETVWRLRHMRDPQSLCAVMPTETYRRIAGAARRHPQFVLPLPREGQGAEMHFLQWTFPSPTTATVLLTHLAEYKTRGEFAQPHTTVTHHLDLAERSGLVMLEGRVMERRGLGVEEGRFLLMCLQKFYGCEALGEAARESRERRRRLMEQFNRGDEGFRVEELLEEVDKVP